MTPLAGTGALARLALRRDRFRLVVWVLLAVGLVAATASSIKSLYPTVAGRQQYAAGSSPASAVLGGPGFGLTSLGGIVVNESATTILVLVALSSSMLVVRHTRREEETGRAELLGAGAVGRHARLASALLVAGGASVLIAIGMVTVLAAYGLSVAGSVAFASAVAGTGVFFACVAAVAAQCAEHARSANATAVAVFGLAFTVRAVGDASATAKTGGQALKNLSWLSPLGWAQQVRAYDGERWWVLVLLVGAATVLAGTAAALSTRRDIGAGLVPSRPDRATAAAGLSSPWALAWRLHRGGLIVWTVGVAVGAGIFGAIAHDVSAAVGQNKDAAAVLEQLGGGRAVVDSYLSWVLGVAGVVAAAYAVAVVVRLRAEETGLRAEPVLATSVTRWQWMASHVLCAVTGIVVLLGTTGVVVGLVHGLRGRDVAHELPRIVVAALVQAPAALLLAAVAVALFGLAPRLSAAAWGYVLMVLLLGQLGGVLRLPRWMIAVSPFAHLPKVGGRLTVTPLLWLAGIAAVLVAAGLVQFRRRDVGGA
jgi:ABC-2 type transport system permease protein